MPFGLTNAPSGFQRFLNTIFADLLDVFVIIYLDDILIFSLNEEDHIKHVSEVFRRLCKHNFFANGKKCTFHTDSMEYLGHIIGQGGPHMDPAKVKTIQDWPEPQKVKDVQSFLGFANFYRHYIHNYSDIVVPLTHLTQKNTPWDFSDKCRLAFSLLKNAFTSALVLTHWHPKLPLIVETNASEYALVAILSIQEASGDIHLIAFHSRTFSDSELNYDIHDKELLAIFDAFKLWQHYLEGSTYPIDVVTDHKNLEYFSTTKILSWCQACWSEFLSGFNMVICFCLGCLGTKPDAPTHHPDLYPKGGEKDIISTLNFKPIFSLDILSASLRASVLLPIALHGITDMDIDKLNKEIISALDTDNLAQSYLADINNTKYIQWSKDTLGFIWIDQRIYIAPSGDLRLCVLCTYHDHPISGHFSINKTLALLR